MGSTIFFFFSSRRRHTRSLCDWSSDVCSSDLGAQPPDVGLGGPHQCGRGDRIAVDGFRREPLEFVHVLIFVRGGRSGREEAPGTAGRPATTSAACSVPSAVRPSPPGSTEKTPAYPSARSTRTW